MRWREDAVLNCMWIHLDTPSLLAQALTVLNNIAVSAQARCIVGNMTPRILEVILITMAEYPLHNQLQYHACVLLRSYSYDTSSLLLMQAPKAQEQLFPLLAKAAEMFPDQCQQRAQHLIERLCGG
mmetsp:Transcript_11372/g.26381  ORF Transcript_11372/g.26381 Transcript_11372/m.26381 type:complete len:126 (-) Transcript_11372:646-1023(-)